MWKFISSFWTDHIRTNQFNSLLRFGVNFLIGILLIHSYLSKDEVGLLEYALFLAYTGSFVFTFAYSSSILAKIDVSQVNERSKAMNDVFWQLLFISIIVSSTLYGILHLLPFFQIDFVPGELFVPIAVLAGLIVLVIPAELYFILYQKAKPYFIYSIAIHGSLLAMVIMALWMNWEIGQILYLYICINIIKLLVVILQVKPRFSFDFKSQKQWFIFTIPLIFHFVLGSTMDYMDGHIVASYFDENQFLFYRFGARELPFSMILLNAISASFIPILRANMQELGQLKKRVNRLMHLIFPLSIVLLFASPYLFQWVYGEEFILSAQVFNFYLLVISSRVLLPHTILYAKKDNKALVVFSAIEFVINLGLSLILINYMGITGVALASVIAFLLNRILSVLYITKKYKVSMKDIISVPFYAGYTSLMIVSFFTVQYFMYG